MRVGDKVKLKAGHFPAWNSNPEIGSRYECVGTITSVSYGGSLPIYVEWSNGSNNTYASRHLVLVASLEQKQLTHCPKCRTVLEKVGRPEEEVQYECPNCLSLITIFGDILEGGEA